MRRRQQVGEAVSTASHVRTPLKDAGRRANLFLSTLPRFLGKSLFFAPGILDIHRGFHGFEHGLHLSHDERFAK